jgi:hypothetical protein
MAKAASPSQPFSQLQEALVSSLTFNGGGALDVFRSVKGLYPAEDMPEYPARVLIVHCLAKGAEWSVAAVPLAPLLSRVRGVPLLQSWRTSFLAVPALATAGTMGMLAYKAGTSMDAAGVDDRAYRISRHQGQLQVDRLAGIGAALGLAAGLIAGSRLPIRGAIPASVSFGCALGVMAHGCTLAQDMWEKRASSAPK